MKELLTVTALSFWGPFLWLACIASLPALVVDRSRNPLAAWRQTVRTMWRFNLGKAAISTLVGYYLGALLGWGSIPSLSKVALVLLAGYVSVELGGILFAAVVLFLRWVPGMAMATEVGVYHLGRFLKK